MDTHTIDQLLLKNPLTRKFYLGCYPADKIPLTNRVPVSIVVNEDEADKPGTHWVAIFIKSKEHVYYFDSYASLPNVNIASYLDRFQGITLNPVPFQSLQSEVCAHYALFFVYMASAGRSMTTITNILKAQNNPDSYVVNFVKRNF